MRQNYARLIGLTVIILCASTAAEAQRRFGPGGGGYGGRAGGMQMNPGVGGTCSPALRGGFAEPRAGSGFQSGYAGRNWAGRPPGGWYGNRGWYGYPGRGGYRGAYPYRGGYWGGYPGLWAGGLGLGWDVGYPYGGYSGVSEVPDVGAEVGAYCATPVRTCQLINPSYIGAGCSCRVTGGRARGTEVP